MNNSGITRFRNKLIHNLCDLMWTDLASKSELMIMSTSRKVILMWMGSINRRLNIRSCDFVENEQ